MIERFLEMSRADLRAALRSGHPLDPAALDDTRYLGVSLGLPGWVDRLAWKTFEKTFCRDQACLRGWNVRLEQTGLDGPVRPLQKRGAPITFGHYRVTDPTSDQDPPGSILLDYGRGGNPALDPTRLVRDPVVALEPGSVEWLLGWTYLELGISRVGTPSYFLLRRLGSLERRVDPPR